MQVGTGGGSLRFIDSGVEDRDLVSVGTIPGVWITKVGGKNGEGTGAIRSTGNGEFIQWRAPGSDTWGSSEHVRADGEYRLEDGEDIDKWIEILVVYDALETSAVTGDTTPAETTATSGSLADDPETSSESSVAEALTNLFYTKTEIDNFFEGESGGKKQVSWDNITNQPSPIGHGTGLVTQHSDVSDAGSGIIISATERTNFTAGYTHSLGDGTDHTYIDQDVRTTASPVFVQVTASILAGTTITDGVASLSGGTLSGLAHLSTVSALVSGTLTVDDINNSGGGSIGFNTSSFSAINDIECVSFTAVGSEITSNNNIDMDDNSLLNVSYVDFNLSFAGSMQEGRLAWNSDDGTLEVGMPGGDVVLQIGQELHLPRGKAIGNDIDNGQVVYISGASGSKPELSLAQADSESEACNTIALATEDILQNQFGYYTSFGLVRDIPVPTATFSDGDELWLSATVSGAFVNVKPTSPNYPVKIGHVILAHNTEGIIFVDIDKDYVTGGSISGFTANSIPYADASGFLTEDNPGLTYDGSELDLNAGDIASVNDLECVSITAVGSEITSNSPIHVVTGDDFVKITAAGTYGVHIYDDTGNPDFLCESGSVTGIAGFRLKTPTYELRHTVQEANSQYYFRDLNNGGANQDVITIALGDNAGGNPALTDGALVVELDGNTIIGANSVSTKLRYGCVVQTGSLSILAGGATITGGVLNVNAAGTNHLATFSSTDNNARISVVDNDTTAYFGAEGGFAFIGGSTLSGGNNVRVNVSTGDLDINLANIQNVTDLELVSMTAVGSTIAVNDDLDIATNWITTTNYRYYETAGQLIWTMTGTGGAEMSLIMDQVNFENTYLRIGGGIAIGRVNVQIQPNIDLNEGTALVSARVNITGGAHDENDIMKGVDGVIVLNDSGTVFGHTYGLNFSTQMTAGDVGTVANNRNAYGSYQWLDLNGGNIYGHARGGHFQIDQEAGHTVSGVCDVIYLNGDFDGTTTGDTSMIRIVVGSNVDYAMYQTATAPWEFASSNFTSVDDIELNSLTAVGAEITYNNTLVGISGARVELHNGRLSVHQDTADLVGLGIDLYKRGTTGDATAAVANNTELGYHNFLGWDGSANAVGAYVLAKTEEAWDGSGHGTELIYATTSNNSTTVTGRWKLRATGAFMPFANNTYDMGGAGSQIKDIYFAGTMYANAGTIDMGAGDIDAVGNLELASMSAVGASILSTSTITIQGGALVLDFSQKIFLGGGGELYEDGAGGALTLHGASSTVTVDTNFTVQEDLYFVGEGSGVLFAEISAYDVADTITISTSGIANKVQITSFDTNGLSNGMTPDHTNDHITVDTEGKYLVIITLTVESSAGLTFEAGFGLFKNNGATQFTNVHRHRQLAGGGGDTGSVALHGVVDLAVNDTLEVWCWNETNTVNIIIDDITMFAEQKGGT